MDNILEELLAGNITLAEHTESPPVSPLTPTAKSDDSDPVLMVVVVSVVVMLLVLLTMVIAFVVYRVRDRHRLKGREPELLTYCTTIDSLHKYWMVDLSKGAARITVEPKEPATLPIRGKADGSSLTESCCNSDDRQISPQLQPGSPACKTNLNKNKANNPSIDKKNLLHEVEVQVYNRSPKLYDHHISTVEDLTQNKDFEYMSSEETDCDGPHYDACSETVSTCHSVGTHLTNFTEISTDFTKSCEGIPYIDDDDFEFSCEENLQATSRLCRSADCLKMSYSSGPSSQYETSGQGSDPWSSDQSPLESAQSGDCSYSFTSGTMSSESGDQRDCDKMLGMHENTAVISLSQMSISIRSCPNSPICKREEENRIKRSYSKEYEGPFSFSETLLYCLPGVRLYDFTDTSSGSEPERTQAPHKPAIKPKPSPERVAAVRAASSGRVAGQVANWEMRTPF